MSGEKLGSLGALSEGERETLLTALEWGYFETPRRISTIELANVLDMSSQTATEHLRHGTKKLLQSDYDHR